MYIAVQFCSDKIFYLRVYSCPNDLSTSLKLGQALKHFPVVKTLTSFQFRDLREPSIRPSNSTTVRASNSPLSNPPLRGLVGSLGSLSRSPRATKLDCYSIFESNLQVLSKVFGPRLPFSARNSTPREAALPVGFPRFFELRNATTHRRDADGLYI